MSLRHVPPESLQTRADAGDEVALSMRSQTPGGVSTGTDLLGEAPSALLVGHSPVMCELRGELNEFARMGVPYLALGESGTGKGEAARYAHLVSPRARGPFVEQSMTTLTPGLEVDRFEGHMAGAYTDAKRDAVGVVEAAHGGTLFLDEIGDADPRMQGLLLHVLQDGRVQRQGEPRPRYVDVWLILATNQDLERATREGQFREDLFHRLPAVWVTLPPLREHLEDLPELTQALLARSVARYRCPLRPLPRSVLDQLARYAWPGNVRELDRALLHFLVRGRLPPQVLGVAPEAERVREVLERHAWNKSRTARALGIARKTLYAKIRAFRLEGSPRLS